VGTYVGMCFPIVRESDSEAIVTISHKNPKYYHRQGANVAFHITSSTIKSYSLGIAIPTKRMLHLFYRVPSTTTVFSST
jgi:hypothetical protein